MRILRVARALDTFTLAELARHADAKLPTVRSLYNRRKSLFRKAGRLSTKKRGGQPRRFTIDRDGALLEIKELLAEDALAAVAHPFESPYQILLWTLPSAPRNERSGLLLSAKLVLAQSADIRADEHHGALKALIALAALEDHDELDLDELERVRVAMGAAIEALRSAEYHALAGALGLRFQQSPMFTRLVDEYRTLRAAKRPLAVNPTIANQPPPARPIVDRAKTTSRPPPIVRIHGTIVDRTENEMFARLERGPIRQETSWHS